jgi:hypothetical protein
MTSATRRAQGRERGRRHRARTKQGMIVYRVQANQRLLIDALQDWGMPDHLTGRHDLVEGAVGDLVQLMITDKVIIKRIHELIAKRRR